MKGFTRAFLIVALGYVCVQGGLQASEKDNNSEIEKRKADVAALISSPGVLERTAEIVERHNHQGQTEMDLRYGLWKGDYEFGYAEYNTEGKTNYLHIYLDYHFGEIAGQEIHYENFFFFEQSPSGYIEIDSDKRKRYDLDYTVIDVLRDFFQENISEVDISMFGDIYSATITDAEFEMVESDISESVGQDTSGAESVDFIVKKATIEKTSWSMVVKDIYLVQVPIGEDSYTAGAILYFDLPFFLDWFFPDKMIVQ